MPRVPSFSLILLLAYFFPSVAYSQTYQQVSPKTVPSKPKSSLEKPSQETHPPSPNEDQVQLANVTALVFASQLTEIQQTGLVEAHGLVIKNIPILETDTFKQLATEYLGQPLTMRKLNELLRKIVLYYRDQDHPVVETIVPEQDITNGVVQILVVEGKLEEVQVSGARWFRPDLFKNEIRLRPDGTLSNNRLESDLDWINNNPFHQASAIYKPGNAPGKTDIEIKVQDRFPARFYSGFEDSGNQLTGADRVFYGLNWGNAFGADHLLNYQFTHGLDRNSLNQPEMTAHSGNYTIPLPWRHQLFFFGSYGEANADIPGFGTLSGKSWESGINYVVPLPPVGDFREQTSAGFTFKENNTNLAQSETNITTSPVQVTNWIWDYNCSYKDPWGSTQYEGSLTYSPGSLVSMSDDASYNAATPGARASYAYGHFSIERDQRLPLDFSYILRGSAQVANGNLVSSEQYGLGGYSTIRGYEERQANGDEGWSLTHEIRTPPISPGQMLGFRNAQDKLQFLGFWDYGIASIKTPQGGDPETILSSVGPGLRYNVGTWVSLRFDYGWQLTDTGLLARVGDQRAHFGVLISY